MTPRGSEATAVAGLTSVLGAQPQHEANREDLGPGRLPLLYEDAEEVGRVGQQQVLQRLEGGADVQEATVLLAAQEALREEGVAQVAQHVAYRRRGRGWCKVSVGPHTKKEGEDNTHVTLA